MTHFLHTEADLQAGLAELVIADPRLKPVAEKAGAFNLRRREPGFPGLCAIVCGQQLSTASAAAIRARLFAAFDPFHHDTVRRARADKLRRLGLSAPKIKSIREIGKAVARGRIDLTAVGNMDADVAHAALTALLWGGAVRIFVLHHMTYSINSLCHFFGRRPFATADESRNLAWLAVPTFGESWHNNHHAFPTSAAHGLRWWQIDPSWMVIRSLERLGLVWDVVRVDERRRARKALPADAT